MDLDKYKNRLLRQDGTLSRIEALKIVVEKGRELTKYIEKSDPLLTFELDSINEEKFNKWISLCIATLEEHYKDSSNTKRFLYIAEKVIDSDVDTYKKLLHILEGILEYEQQKI